MVLKNKQFRDIVNIKYKKQVKQHDTDKTK